MARLHTRAACTVEDPSPPASNFVCLPQTNHNSGCKTHVRVRLALPCLYAGDKPDTPLFPFVLLRTRSSIHPSLPRRRLFSAVKGTFIPAQHFEGKKLGYFFAKGIHGLGYYMDAAQAVRQGPVGESRVACCCEPLLKFTSRCL